MTSEEHFYSADELLDAQRSGKQIGVLTLRHPEMGMDDAYAIQKAICDTRL